jgi:hypothetical protein
MREPSFTLPHSFVSQWRTRIHGSPFGLVCAKHVKMDEVFHRGWYGSSCGEVQEGTRGLLTESSTAQARSG